MSTVFSSKPVLRTPLGKTDSTSFDVIKINREGKAQPRRFCLSSDGVRNMKGEEVRWFVPRDSLLGIYPTTPDGREFTLCILQHYRFFAESQAQLKQIIQAQQTYQLENRDFSKMGTFIYVCYKNILLIFYSRLHITYIYCNYDYFLFIFF